MSEVFYTRDELERAIAKARDYEFAKWLTMTIGLVAETHPDILRESLEKVFNLEIFNARADEIAKRYRQGLAMMGRLEADLRILEDKINQATNRL